MTDEPTPLRPEAAEENIFNYRVLSGDTKLAQLEDALRRREQQHWECKLAVIALTAIPADERDPIESQEIDRLQKTCKALEYGINQLRAMKALM